MLEAIMNNIIMVAKFIAAFGAIYAGWIVASILVNVKVYDEKFDLKKFFAGVVKMGGFCLAFFLLTAGVTVIPLLLAEYNIVAIDLAQAINATFAVVILTTASYKRGKEAFDFLIQLLEITDEEIEEIRIDSDMSGFDEPLE